MGQTEWTWTWMGVEQTDLSSDVPMREGRSAGCSSDWMRMQLTGGLLMKTSLQALWVSWCGKPSVELRGWR